MNKKQKDFFKPSKEQLENYYIEAYDLVYERGKTANYFVGKLNGRTLKEFLTDINRINYFEE